MIVYLQCEDGVLIREEPCDGYDILTSVPGSLKYFSKPYQVINVCGIVLANVNPSHITWQNKTKSFGINRKILTVEGNFHAQKTCLSFKGASSYAGICRVLHSLDIDTPPSIQLFVASVGLGRNIHVKAGCLLETRLSRVPWVSIYSRLEEVCPFVVFYIRSWASFKRDLHVHTASMKDPLSTTVTVTRQGALTVRLTWGHSPWSEDDFRQVVLKIRDWVFCMI
jgi:hypothetical protein